MQNIYKKSKEEFEKECYNNLAGKLLLEETDWDYGSFSIDKCFRTPYEYIENILSNYITPKTKVLDYCCGIGKFSILPAQKGAFVYGIDISDKSIKVAKKRAKENNVDKKTQFLQMNAEHLDFEDKCFDLILCYGSMSYLNLVQAFTELKRVLKKDGTIIIVDTLGYNPLLNLNRLRYYFTGKRQLYHIQNVFKLKQFCLVKKYFNIIDTQYFDFLILSEHIFSFLKNFHFLIKKMDKIFLSIPFYKYLAFKFIIILKQKEID